MSVLWADEPRDRCQVKRCRSGLTAALIYLKRRVCDRCWRKYTTEDQPEDALRRALGIESPESEAV